MDSEDRQFFGILMTAILIGVVLGIFIGDRSARSRIYDRCLKDNSLMTYKDADDKCKKIVYTSS